jgi:hypothetical protein
MAEYTFNRMEITINFLIYIDDSAGYGYFEHGEREDECSGGLWFDGNELINYDGVSKLPREVISALRKIGVIVSEKF